MKRAKIMLMGIAVVAVVGAGLAFKANRFTESVFYKFTTTTPQKGCFLTTTLPYTTIGVTTTTIPYSSTTFATTVSTLCVAHVLASASE